MAMTLAARESLMQQMFMSVEAIRRLVDDKVVTSEGRVLPPSSRPELGFRLRKSPRSLRTPTLHSVSVLFKARTASTSRCSLPPVSQLTAQLPSRQNSQLPLPPAFFLPLSSLDFFSLPFAAVIFKSPSLAYCIVF
jgi:hypothetical protein